MTKNDIKICFQRYLLGVVYLVVFVCVGMYGPQSASGVIAAQILLLIVFLYINAKLKAKQDEDDF